MAIPFKAKCHSMVFTFAHFVDQHMLQGLGPWPAPSAPKQGKSSLQVDLQKKRYIN